MIIQSELKRQLNYNPENGTFIWKINKCGHTKIGNIAGGLREDGYWTIKINQKHYYAHRLAWLYMTGLIPKVEIDHKNLIKHDNRWYNLREATTSQNGFNKSIPSNNKSGYKGVGWSKDKNKWRVRATINNKENFLGYFNTTEEASEAYQTFVKLHHGEFLYNDKVSKV